jgi:hypothetical protein
LEGFHHTQHIDVHHLLKGINVFGVFGKRAATHARIGNDDVGHTDSRHKILCRILNSGSIAHIQRIAKNFMRKFCGKSLQQFTAPGEGGDDCAALKIMAREG